MCKELGIIIKNEIVVVSSKDIAKKFNKEHRNILRDIREMECSEEFRQHNFELSYYMSEQNKKFPMYLMTKDGMILLAMGYNGEKFIEFKEKYIKEFNKMQNFIIEKQSQEWLQTRKGSKLVRRNETDNLKLLLGYAIKNGSKTYEKTPNRLFSQYSKLANKCVGICTGQREICTWKVLITLQTLEDIIQHIVMEEMDKNTDYHDIYKICKKKCNEMIEYAYLPEQRLLK